MYEVGKGSSKDRLIGKFYDGKFFPSYCLYMKDCLVGNLFQLKTFQFNDLSNCPFQLK